MQLQVILYVVKCDVAKKQNKVGSDYPAKGIKTPNEIIYMVGKKLPAV